MVKANEGGARIQRLADGVLDPSIGARAGRSAAEQFSAFDALSDAVAVADFNKDLLLWNTAFAQLIGYRRQELVGANCHDLTPAVWDVSEMQSLRPLLTGERSYVDYPKEYQHRNGQLIPITIRVTLLEGSSELDSRFLVVVRQVRSQTEDLEERIRDAARRWELTPRQAQVLREVAHGLSNKEVGSRLRCAESTVELHMTAILKKSATTSRTELLARLFTTP